MLDKYPNKIFLYFFMDPPKSNLSYIDRVPSFHYKLKTSFRQLMQIWQLFIILKQPVHISVTVFYNLTKLTNHLFIFTIKT